MVSCVLDFPYGYSGAAVKRAAAAEYAAKGVHEIDMVMNYGYAKGGDWALSLIHISGPMRVFYDTYSSNHPLLVSISSFHRDERTGQKVAYSARVRSRLSHRWAFFFAERVL